MNIAQLVTGPLSVNTLFIPIDSNRLVVVDPGGDALSIIAYIAAQHSTVALILLTHGHFDHVTGLPQLALAFPDAPIAIHEADSFFLGEGALERHAVFLAAIGGELMVRRYREPIPAATLMLKDNQSPPIPGMEGWIVMHTPGHSPGSICLHNAEAKILIAGDTLFNAGFGRTDAPGGSDEELEKSLTRLTALPASTLVIPGHGARTTIARELGMGG